MHHRYVVPLLMLAAGCAAPDPKTAAAQPQPSCERVYRVGSNIPVTNCDAPKTEAERQRMITEIMSLPRPAPSRPAAPGS
jgi:hypothetical protein